jgi:transcriptional regulator with XRE-family HTH domain
MPHRVSTWTREQGQQVADARRVQRLTQRQLADRVGIDSQYLSKVERAFPGATPSDGLRSSLERELGIVLDGAPPPTTGPMRDDYPNRLTVRQHPEYANYHPRVREIFEGWPQQGGDFKDPHLWQDLLDRIDSAYHRVGDTDVIAFLRAVGWASAGEPDEARKEKAPLRRTRK